MVGIDTILNREDEIEALAAGLLVVAIAFLLFDGLAQFVIASAIGLAGAIYVSPGDTAEEWHYWAAAAAFAGLVGIYEYRPGLLPEFIVSAINALF